MCFKVANADGDLKKKTVTETKPITVSVVMQDIELWAPVQGQEVNISRKPLHHQICCVIVVYQITLLALKK